MVYRTAGSTVFSFDVGCQENTDFSLECFTVLMGTSYALQARKCLFGNMWCSAFTKFKQSFAKHVQLGARAGQISMAALWGQDLRTSWTPQARHSANSTSCICLLGMRLPHAVPATWTTSLTASTTRRMRSTTTRIAIASKPLCLQALRHFVNRAPILMTYGPLWWHGNSTGHPCTEVSMDNRFHHTAMTVLTTFCQWLVKMEDKIMLWCRSTHETDRWTTARHQVKQYTTCRICRSIRSWTRTTMTHHGDLMMNMQPPSAWSNEPYSWSHWPRFRDGKTTSLTKLWHARHLRSLHHHYPLLLGSGCDSKLAYLDHKTNHDSKFIEVLRLHSDIPIGFYLLWPSKWLPAAWWNFWMESGMTLLPVMASTYFGDYTRWIAMYDLEELHHQQTRWKYWSRDRRRRSYPLWPLCSSRWSITWILRMV